MVERRPATVGDTGDYREVAVGLDEACPASEARFLLVADVCLNDEFDWSIDRAFLRAKLTISSRSEFLSLWAAWS